METMIDITRCTVCILAFLNHEHKITCSGTKYERSLVPGCPVAKYEAKIDAQYNVHKQCKCIVMSVRTGGA